MIQQYHLEDDVLILGYREDIRELIALMDLVVLPSYHEGMPRILMESAAMGKPVVATRVVGTIETVIDDVTGLLVPMKDEAELADGMFRLLNDPNQALELGRNARNHALSNFDERHFFWRTDQVYRHLISDKLGIDVSPLLKPIPAESKELFI